MSTPAQNTSFLLFWRYQQRTSCQLSVFNILCVAQIAEPGHTWSVLTCEMCPNKQQLWSHLSNELGPRPLLWKCKKWFSQILLFWLAQLLISGLFIFIRNGNEKESKNHFSLPSSICLNMQQYSLCKKNEIKEIYSHKHDGQLNCLVVNWILIRKTTERAEPSTSCWSLYKQKCC